MARRHSNHNNTGYTHDLELSGSGAEKSIMAAKFVQRLFWDGTIWRIYDHAHTPAQGQTHGTVSGGFYVPPFLSRGFKIEGSSLFLAYDMPGSIIAGETAFVYCRSEFNNRTWYPGQITALYLDTIRAQTTCDAVELLG